MCPTVSYVMVADVVPERTERLVVEYFQFKVVHRKVFD